MYVYLYDSIALFLVLAINPISKFFLNVWNRYFIIEFNLKRYNYFWIHLIVILNYDAYVKCYCSKNILPWKEECYQYNIIYSMSNTTVNMQDYWCLEHEVQINESCLFFFFIALFASFLGRTFYIDKLNTDKWPHPE